MNTYVILKGYFASYKRKVRKKYLFFTTQFDEFFHFYLQCWVDKKLWSIINEMCFVKIFSSRRKVILKQILNLVHQPFIINCIVMIWFSCNSFVKNVGIFPYLLKHMQMNDEKYFFLLNKSSLNFQNLFKEKDRSFSVFNLFWSPKGKYVCKRTDLISHKSWTNEKKRRERKKNCCLICVFFILLIYEHDEYEKRISPTHFLFQVVQILLKIIKFRFC